MRQVVVSKNGTLAIIQRKFDTNDDQDRAVQAGVAYPVIWAFGGPTFTYHGPSNRGTAQVTFIPTSRATPISKQFEATKTLVMPNVSLPTNLTTYYCHRFQLGGAPAAHIVGYEAILDNAKYVHHIGTTHELICTSKAC
jgi:Copper type II ascorbate-dependent monooxygenase, N-terminal domain